MLHYASFTTQIRFGVAEMDQVSATSTPTPRQAPNRPSEDTKTIDIRKIRKETEKKHEEIEHIRKKHEGLERDILEKDMKSFGRTSIEYDWFRCDWIMTTCHDKMNDWKLGECSNITASPCFSLVNTLFSQMQGMWWALGRGDEMLHFNGTMDGVFALLSSWCAFEHGGKASRTNPSNATKKSCHAGGPTQGSARLVILMFFNLFHLIFVHMSDFSHFSIFWSFFFKSLVLTLSLVILPRPSRSAPGRLCHRYGGDKGD